MSDVHRTAVVGGGYMGGGIAQTLALNGFTCALADASHELAERSVRRLIDETERYEVAGLFPSGSSKVITDHLFAAESLEAAVGDADYVTEAVPEDVGVKREVLTRISHAARSDAILTSNTSAIPIGELARAVEGSERFLGVHWMNPAFFVPCVEVIPTKVTRRSFVQAVMRLLRDAGKSPTEVSDSPGFVANRLQYALFKECSRLVEEGIARPDQIDEVVRNSFGFRLPFFGPFAIADIAGLDVYRGAFAILEDAYGERMSTPSLLIDRVAAGRLGTKSRSGFYDINEEQVAEVAEYRDRAYARMNALRQELPAPDIRAASVDVGIVDTD